MEKTITVLKPLDFDFRVLVKDNKIDDIRQYPHKRKLTRKEVKRIKRCVCQVIDMYSLKSYVTYGMCFIFYEDGFKLKEIQEDLYIPPEGLRRNDIILYGHEGALRRARKRMEKHKQGGG